MTRRDISIEDFDGLMAAHESRQRAQCFADSHRYPASGPREAIGGMRAIAALLVVMLASAIAGLTLLVSTLIRHAPALHNAVMTFIDHIARWVS